MVLHLPVLRILAATGPSGTIHHSLPSQIRNSAPMCHVPFARSGHRFTGSGIRTSTYLGAQEASFHWPQELRYLSDFSAGRGGSKGGPRAQLAILCLQARAVLTHQRGGPVSAEPPVLCLMTKKQPKGKRTIVRSSLINRPGSNPSLASDQPHDLQHVTQMACDILIC